MSSTPAFPAAARPAILAWYAERGRPLAFRRTTDPYAILVSEAMAQQTQAARAADHWERFIARFPTVNALAAASPADVVREWQGLGYNRRALALWRSAGVIVETHDGRVPSSIEDLEALPGVGPYTARAVAAIAFGARVGAVDVNVRRVIGRVSGGGSEALTPAAIQAVADAAVPAKRPGTWTHAVMDLGATVCTARAPKCEVCPARRWCRYAAAHFVASADPAAAPNRAAAPVGTARKRPPMTSIPFPLTTRWLRGRILDSLRATPDGAWFALDTAIGDHGLDRVRAAAQALARDGMVELDARDDAILRARLPLS